MSRAILFTIILQVTILGYLTAYAPPVGIDTCIRPSNYVTLCED